MIARVLLALLAAALPTAANAAVLDGASLRWPWALPFAGILLTIAIAPAVAPRLWHRHYGKIAFFWSALTMAPLAAATEFSIAFAAFAHVALAEYRSFIVLMFTLYVVAGGILVTGNLRGTPLTNTVFLVLGTMIASVVGTTGAAMILIRPLLRANAARLENAHVVVFFTFLVCNIGGALTPLGNPPLFLGFLQGVDFFWTARHLWAPTLVTSTLVLAIFIGTDLWHYRVDRRITMVGEAPRSINLATRGKINFVLIAAIVAAILGSAFWRPGISFDLYGTVLQLQDLVRDGALLLIALASLALTPNEHREANDFTWEPIVEVAILFAGIFVCIVPVLAMLQAGRAGAFAWVLAAANPNGMPNDVAYFWFSGLLSAFLDNAPSYLVFFETAGGDAQSLMGPLASTLAAISMGAAYMGAITYIGNAPNLMIYAIATERGVKMPSFFAYMGWACLVLLPVFALITVVFLARP
jgi:Na+/H+ antiporter NhaD/arsenite permease-like protein